MKYLLDTNILIYLKDPYSEHYDTETNQAFWRAESGLY